MRDGAVLVPSGEAAAHSIAGSDHPHHSTALIRPSFRFLL